MLLTAGSYAAAEFAADGKMLALGYEDGRLLVEARPGARHELPAEMDEAKLRSLWKALAGSDAKLAYQARWLLGGTSKQTLALFRGGLRPASQVTAQQVDTWIGQLDGNSFEDSGGGDAQLEKTGYAFEPGAG